VGVNVCHGDGQIPLPTGRLLYTERLAAKMGVPPGAHVHGDPPSALPSQVMRGRILARGRSARRSALQPLLERERTSRGHRKTGDIDPERSFADPYPLA
jgi:hypothetical protein